MQAISETGEEIETGGFVHLHTHSEFSLLDGASRVNELVDTAKAMGQTAIAITDHGVLWRSRFLLGGPCREAQPDHRLRDVHGAALTDGS